MFNKISPMWKRYGAIASNFMLVMATASSAQANPPSQTSFQLVPASQNLIACMAANPSVTPTVNVTVTRGELNDLMTITLKGFKPGIQFDLFTIQNSNKLANGNPDPNFKGFGLSWYQSDLEPGATTIKTILLDQIFGFVDVKGQPTPVPPTNTFNVGFWFNNPQDAKNCGFDPSKPTPFNGEHKAGPLAFISLPNSITKLGPLCTNPNKSTNPATCNP